MLAARAYEGEGEFRLEELDTPRAAAGEIVINVQSAGLTPGVLELWRRGMYPIMPRTLGNEAAGMVLEVGSGVERLSVGQRVRLHPNLVCRHCAYCLTGREQLCRECSVIGHGIFGRDAMPLYQRYHHGALAEFVVAPEWAVEFLPDEISFDVGAKIHDVADALHALRTVDPPAAGVLIVTGATGTIGASLVRLSPLFGISRLIAVARSRARLEQVKDLNPDLVEIVALEELDTNWPAEQGLVKALRKVAPEGVDGVIDCIPEGPAGWQAIASLRPGGRAALMAGNPAPPPLPAIALMINCWQIHGSRNCTREDALQVSNWIRDGLLVLDDLITHRFALEDIRAATRIVRDRPEPAWMTVIHPHAHKS